MKSPNVEGWARCALGWAPNATCATRPVSPIVGLVPA